MNVRNSEPIRVLIADDHDIVRTGIAGMLADLDEVAVVGQAPDGAAAVRAVEELQPDVILMDLRMPVMDGPAAIQEMRDQGIGIGILVLTTYDTDTDILRAIEAGANGYLLKDTTREELVRAIYATARGESWLTPAVASRLMNQVRKPALNALSNREIDVLRRVAKGLSNKEIAMDMHISQATVKTHLIHVFRKLNANDRTSAVTFALERGIITI